MTNYQSDQPGPRPEPGGTYHGAGFEPLEPLAEGVPPSARVVIGSVKLVHKTDNAIRVQRGHHLSKPTWLGITHVRVLVNGRHRHVELMQPGDTFDVNVPVWLYRKVYRDL